MSEHDHQHEHKARQTKYGEVDPAQAARLRAEARENTGDVAWALQMAADSDTQSEQLFWLRKVDGFRYMADRQAARDRLDQQARRNLEADERLAGTEASLRIVRIVGNACILALVPGAKRAPGKYALARRIAGETGTEGYGAPRGDQWVVQSLRMNALHEFSVVSEDSDSAKEVRGPWLSVPIGSVSTDAINAREREKAEALYAEREAAHARAAQAHSDKVAKRRQEQADALKQQQADADAMNAKRDREWEEKKAAHEKAVRELPLTAPRDMGIRLRDLKGAGMVADISFLRGTKAPNLYQFKVDGSVLGYHPDGRHSGRKPENHRYERTVTVPRGRNVEIHIYAVTDHGDSPNKPFTIPVPQSLCDDPPDDPPAPAPKRDPEPKPDSPSRVARIVASILGLFGRRVQIACA